MRADAGIDVERPCKPGAPWLRSRGEDEAFAANPSITWTSAGQVGEHDAARRRLAVRGEVRRLPHRRIRRRRPGALVTRNGNDYTRRFPPSRAPWKTGRRDDDGVNRDGCGNRRGRKDRFPALQNFLRDPSGKHPAYVAFDLLAFEGDLRDRPLAEARSWSR
ncbi:MAG: hypothetical protein ACLT98_06085 [Eggerthellaceae bacterium]